MKESLRLLLIPLVLVIGTVGYWCFTNGTLQNQSDTESQIEMATSTESSATSSNSIAEFHFRSGTSSQEVLSPEELEARQRELEKTRWLRSNLVMEEPCDFFEMENFAEGLLSQPEWQEVIEQYPHRKYVRQDKSRVEAYVMGRLLYACHIEVKLETDEVLLSEDVEYSKYLNTWDVISLVNKDEDYHDGFAEAILDDVSFVMLPADGPSGSSYGSYVYDGDKKSVRLVTVDDGRSSRISYHEADVSGEQTCPCRRHLRLEITNPITAEQVMIALKKGVLSESYKSEY